MTIMNQVGSDNPTAYKRVPLYSSTIVLFLDGNTILLWYTDMVIYYYEYGNHILIDFVQHLKPLVSTT